VTLVAALMRARACFALGISRPPAKRLTRTADGRKAVSCAGAKSMHNLRIEYVQRLPRRAADLPPDVVELWIVVSGRRVVVDIVRRGFILAAPVMRLIRERIISLALATIDTSRHLPKRIGLSPDLSPDRRQFLDELLQKDDSWSFFVNCAGIERPS